MSDAKEVNNFGCCVQLFRELENEEPQLIKHLLYMHIADFNNLLAIVTTLISKKDTNN